MVGMFEVASFRRSCHESANDKGAEFSAVRGAIATCERTFEMSGDGIHLLTRHCNQLFCVSCT